MSVIASGNDLYLTGAVGSDLYFDHFGLTDVIEALDAFDDDQDITVHVNSPGGYADQGVAIYSLLTARKGKCHVMIDGLAASAGSLIAMAGNTIKMSTGALLMIHDPWGATVGNSDEHERTRLGLEATAQAYAKVYSKRTGKPVSECRRIMKAETWFTADEAVSAGFANSVGSGNALAFAAFDYGRFKNAPEELIAQAKSQKWERPAVTAKATKQNKSQKGKSMSENDEKAVRANVQARIKAILTDDEAADRTALAEHLAFETDMSAEDAIAILAKAEKAASRSGSYEEQRTKAAAGTIGVVDQNAALGRLAMPQSSAGAGESKLVANMKRRFGKE